MQLNGYYQYPGRAAREAARLTLSEQHLTLEQGSHRQLVMMKDVAVSDALGTIPLTLTFPDGGRFVPEDDRAFRQWWQQRHRPGLVHRLEQHRRGVLLTLLGTLVAIACWIWVILPVTSQVLAQHIPSYVERQIGQQTFTLLQNTGFTAGRLTPAQQQRINRLFRDTVPAEMKEDPTPLRLKIMHFDGGANAFMLADGTLIVSDDLVRMARSDDAIAAVMLHEMGHHQHRHVMRMLVRSSLVSLSYLWLTGDVSGIGDTLLQSAAFIDQMQYSRSMEREADDFAIAQMKAQGRSLAAMAEIYGQLEQSAKKQGGNSDLPEWMSTHPDMPARIKAVQAAE
ncbi:MAG TPA: peptidase M48 [Erwinia persicina]|uniref:M48 family metallopeptidase n=1 Tax=Erwinia persicina TaxID=55211 RepID=A0A4U3F6W3_9GAMM|nr:M48 family metallopeptidase [Erwinia persicina]MBC3945007.1 M48 family metallopeptidase [Erwinia persicina]MBD8107588.1 M48 family metallopeptidase [Erwinia persicina]MBD8167617.1 M48 family metallopeptidase [Erwinia persicina]MBD8210668.1 M48 family metallopeptidase [Erwinia persicina]MCQ4103261.1 M48 family metallopeptidase [Erwinia persicina]